MYVDRKPMDLEGRVPHQSLGALRHLLEYHVVRRAIRAALPHHATWLTVILPARLEVLADSGMPLRTRPARHVSRCRMHARRFSGLDRMG